MANGYKVRIDNISTDGSNVYVEATINDGAHAFPPIRPVFPTGTAASVINAYLQQVADNGPTLSQDLGVLVGTTLTGA